MKRKCGHWDWIRSRSIHSIVEKAVRTASIPDIADESVSLRSWRLITDCRGRLPPKQIVERLRQELKNGKSGFTILRENAIELVGAGDHHC